MTVVAEVHISFATVYRGSANREACRWRLAGRGAFRAPPLHAAPGEDPVMRKGGGWKKSGKKGRKKAELVTLNRMVVRRKRLALVCRLVV